MKVSELRIGNLVKHASSGKTCIVEGIYESGIMTSFLSEKGSATGGIQFFEPIKITEEWLERFGFDGNYGGNSDYFNFIRKKELGNSFGDFSISHYDSTQWNVWRGDRYCGIFKLEFVHELQNLFFVFNQVELQLK